MHSPQFPVRLKRIVVESPFQKASLKVIFLAAVCRPRYNVTAKKMFDGKIGIWPFIEMLPAKRSSKNRPAGTILPMPVAITWEVYRTAITEKVIPTIKKS